MNVRTLITSCIALLSFLVTSCQSTEQHHKKEVKPMQTKIQFIRNATMKIQYAGKTFLTDPMLSKKESLNGFLHRDRLANPTSALPININELLEGIEMLLVTHTHIPAENGPSGASDHFDAKAIEVIAKQTPIYAQPFDVQGLKRVGFQNVTPVEGSIQIENIKITRFEGVHSDVEALLPLVGESSGYVLEAKGYPTILWTGDVLLTDSIKAIIKKHQPDLIIAHVGGAQLPINKKGDMAKLVMDDKDAIDIAKLAPNATIIAIHMEALDHCPVTRKGLREKADQAGIKQEQLRIPEDGETLIF